MEITPKNQEAWINSVVKNHELISELKKSVNNMNEEIIKEARELVDRFYRTDYLMEWVMAKDCARICCDEIIKSGKDVDEFSDSHWLEVKKAIEQL